MAGRNRVYHWKHGWIPLDHAAALKKAHGSQSGARKLVPVSNADLPRRSHVLAGHNPGNGNFSVSDTKTNRHARLTMDQADQLQASGKKITGVNTDGSVQVEKDIEGIASDLRKELDAVPMNELPLAWLNCYDVAPHSFVFARAGRGGLSDPTIVTGGGHAWTEATFEGERVILDPATVGQQHFGQPFKRLKDVDHPIFYKGTERFNSIDAYANGPVGKVQVALDAAGQADLLARADAQMGKAFT